MSKRVVVKLGTSVLTGGTDCLFRPNIINLIRQCAALQARGHEIIICSSGAGAAGREQLNHPKLPRTLITKQMVAAVGQSRLMRMWADLFDIYSINVGQILLTRADVESRQRYLNARDTMLAMLEHKIVPIINENDAVANEEIKVGDNDNLSALVAVVAEADILLLLTDQDGLFTADPRNDPSAELIGEIDAIDDAIWQVAGGSVSGLGIGGMVTKIESAEIATRAGIDVIIARGTLPNVITRLVEGEKIGTRFIAQDAPLERRKRWLFAGTKPLGKVTVDDGAGHALKSKGRSLLPAGIVTVSGTFSRGDSVSVVGSDGKEIARGISRYSSQAMAKICGLNSAEIEPILGYTYGNAAVHRNDMILI